MPAKNKMTSARTALFLDAPFFGVLASRLVLREDPACKTAWTNGRELGYNPQFVEALPMPQLLAVFAHEVLHCANGHPWRREGREKELFNIACDRAINGILKECGYSLPDGCEMPAGDEIGKSAEWIYDRLLASKPQPQPQPENAPDANQSPEEELSGDSSDEQGEGEGEPKPEPLGELRDAPTQPDADGDPAPTEADWQQAVQQAVIVAQGQGLLPAGLARFAAEACKPRVDWKSALRRFLQDTAKSDYSWTRPNSRYMASGLYLPALHCEAMGEIAIAIDTSGSIDNVALSNAKAELDSIVEEMQPQGVTVMYCDAALQRTDHFTQGEEIDWQPCGGGGTSFEPVFSAIQTAEPQPVALVFITDLYGSFPSWTPETPTLWLTDTRSIPVPFGEVLPMN
jgi:predicted metal-dependent peptidase